MAGPAYDQHTQGGPAYDQTAYTQGGPAYDQTAYTEGQSIVPAQPAHVPAGQGVMLPPALVAEFFAITRRMAMQNDLQAAEKVLSRSISEFLVADRVHIRYWHPGAMRLWQLGESPHQPGRDRGLSMHVAQTGQSVCAAFAGQLPVYDRDLDDPEGDGNERILAQPVFVGGQIIAVVMVVRRQNRNEYSAEERTVLEAISGTTASILQHFVFRHFGEAQEQRMSAAGELFRTEAIQHRDGARDRDGAPIRISPGWVKWCYRVLIIAAIASIVFVAFARVGHYSQGAAIVQVEGAEKLRARSQGTVSKIYVRAGDTAKTGDVLVEFHAGNEALALKEVETEYERQLAAFLLDPADVQAKSRLSSAASQLGSARGRVQQRSIRATTDGTVSEVRVRQGMLVNPGEHVVTLASGDAAPKILALLPGADLPQVKPGMKLRLDLHGYDTPSLYGTVEAVGSEVMGAQGVAQAVGRENMDSLPVGGPVFIVEARLPKKSFEYDDAMYRLSDGMTGFAEVEISTEPVVFALVPGLKKLLK